MITVINTIKNRATSNATTTNDIAATGWRINNSRRQAKSIEIGGISMIVAVKITSRYLFTHTHTWRTKNRDRVKERDK